jgi:ribulose-5-phosphate 4-epimerase/fuculose-1-phosphate aldolase
MRPVNHLSLRKRIARFVAASHRVDQEGLVSCASGNLSWRISADLMLITGTGRWLGKLAADEVAVCRIRDGTVVRGCTPSKELGFHAGILRVRPEVDVVMHFGSPHATALACSGARKVDCSVVPEVPYYLGQIVSVPYLPPGSKELAGAVIEACREHDLVILLNHGQVTVGTDFDDAFQKAHVYERACQIVLEAGTHLRPLSPDAVAALMAERSAARSRGA